MIPLLKYLSVPLALLTLVPHPATATEGVLEINHACAVGGGCFGGDGAGYPVTIDEPGSYRLTGNLTPPDINTSAIEISVNDVTLDLAGFAIIFPGNGCVSQANCPQGSGDGVSGGRRTAIRNGIIKNAGRRGISLSDIAIVERIRVDGCGENGIVLGPRGILLGSHVNSCGANGASLGGNTTFSHNVFAFNDKLQNGSADRVGGVAVIGNVCGDDTCTHRPVRRYYATTTLYQGDQAANPGNCESGFHFASFAELIEASSLQYETALGRTANDSGSGPPGINGWVRSGTVNLSARNCSGWTSSDSGDDGTFLGYSPSEISVLSRESPWTRGLSGCAFGFPIWCVED